MPTIGDNIHSMAALVSDVKKTHHLSETTVMRIVDMNFALAQETGTQTFSGDEPFPGSEPDFNPFDGMVDEEGNPIVPMSADEIEASVADDSDETPTPQEGLN